MSIDMSQFHQVFFDEAEEHLAAMECLLLAIDLSNPDTEHLNAIFRAAHSVKGGSGTFGFSDVADVTHTLETLLDRIRNGEVSITREMVDAFLKTGDVLRALLSRHRNVFGRRAGDAVGDAAGKVGVETIDEITRVLNGFYDPDKIPNAVAVAAVGGGVNISDDEAGGCGSQFVYQIHIPNSEKVFLEKKHLDQLVDDLANIGSVRILRTTEKTISMELVTYSSIDDLKDIFSFFLDPEQIHIEIQSVLSPLSSKGYGLFDDHTESSSDAAAESTHSVHGESGRDDPAWYGLFDTEDVEHAVDGSAHPTQTQNPDRKSYIGVGEITNASDQTNTQAAPLVGVGDSSIRVSVGKVDSMINLVGELVITQSMLSTIASQMDESKHKPLLDRLNQLERNTRDLQDSVMSVRMMPINLVFSRFQRIVHDFSTRTGKQVQLKIVGETTELDKSLIESLIDPLTHLVRNSLDHGIESALERTSIGKDASGTITLKAAHQGGNIVIEVLDDGAGLDRARILSKAREKGMDVSDTMSDNDVWGLIFTPGFSTAESITEVSGRGVGMDVVKRNVERIGGRVYISSQQGRGTSILIRLPLTLAILDGMSVSTGTHTYIIPLGFIIESFRPKANEINNISGGGKVVLVRGEYLPIIALHRLFNIDSPVQDPCDGILVLIEADGRKVALFVDALVGQHQVVIKSLETHYRKVNGISGATIMGDGRVALIMDAGELVRMA